VYVWASFGWLTLALTLVTVAGVLVGWRRGHRSSFSRFLGLPYASRWRAWRVYGRRWAPAMAASGLAVAFGGDKYIPRLLSVRATAFGDEVTVQMLPGQTPDAWAKAAVALSHTFRIRDGRARLGTKPDRIVLVFRRVEPLTGIIAPFAVPMVPDFRRLPVARREDGGVFYLNLSTHVLIVGASDTGKGSVLTSILNAIAGGIGSGLVRVVGIDPKEGMELHPSSRLFWRFDYGPAEQMADTLEEMVTVMKERAGRLRGITRQHVATVDDPTYVILIDELGALTAYGTDRKTKDRIKDALGLLLSQGRACGVHVVAALQDPRKEVLSIRDLFPVRVALRLAESSHADMVLNDGAYDRGAHCEQIPESLPGVGYVLTVKDPQPVQVRFSYHDDRALADLCTRYGRLHAVPFDDAEWDAA
jgi:S-DNA-T family DNA segregation ATPase FtsK/SpoIIIE